jgi:hypothetical protein
VADSFCCVQEEAVESTFLNDSESLLTSADSGANHFSLQGVLVEFMVMPCAEEHNKDKSHS